SFGYPGLQVLHEISFEVQQQEFVTLLGPSGCGKSTLMNLTAGSIRPNSGTVRFDGQPLRGVNTQIGYMTQDDTLLPWRTVEENLRLPSELRARRSLAGPDFAERVRDHLRLTNLSDAAKLYPSQLS